MKKIRLALLDMYDGLPNQGMRAIREILEGFEDEIAYTEFDIRAKNEIPGLDFQIYISSGGPGDPNEADAAWAKNWNALIGDLWEHNLATPAAEDRKYVFFVCHSFQMACLHFDLGEVTKRVVTSFGIYPCHKTPEGREDSLLQGLKDPYFVVDSRDWQLVQPHLNIFKESGAKILSLEKIRTHLEYERAIMAVRFSDEFVGTQYHPEADPFGMLIHFAKPENKEVIVKNYSVRKYNSMMKGLEHPERIERTRQSVIPSFLRNALTKIQVGLIEKVK